MKRIKKNVSLLLVGSLFMTTTIPQNLQAQSTKEYRADLKANNQKVADAFNKFRYDMTVEWDQRDAYFKEHAQKELENSLDALKSEGVTEVEILGYMQNNILDQKARKDYDRLLTALEKQNLHEDEASSVAMNYMEKNYKQGVGFSGGGSVSYRRAMIIVGIIIVGVVTYLIIKHRKKGENSNSSSTGDTSTTTMTSVDNSTTITTTTTSATADTSSTSTTADTSSSSSTADTSSSSSTANTANTSSVSSTVDASTTSSTWIYSRESFPPFLMLNSICFRCECMIPGMSLCRL
jgi:hypothetical protein